MAGNGWTLLEIAGMAEHGWKWLEFATVCAFLPWVNGFYDDDE